jgi:hypothetical protein
MYFNTSDLKLDSSGVLTQTKKPSQRALVMGDLIATLPAPQFELLLAEKNNQIRFF